MSDVPSHAAADDDDEGVGPEAVRAYRRELNELARRGEKRTRVVAVRFTEAEYREVERTALEENYRQLGAWIRERPVRLLVSVTRKRRSAERRERGQQEDTPAAESAGGSTEAPAESVGGSTAGVLSVEQWQLVHDLRVELSRVGNNVNQVARALNTAESAPKSDGQWRKALEVTNERMDATRGEVARLYELLSRLEERQR